MSFTVEYVEPTPLFTRPAILQHPHIPRGMGGINPRTIEGEAWWNEQRQAAFVKNNHCCWACGAPAGKDLFYPAIEGHEAYDYDWKNAVMTLNEVQGLCHKCHMFIHSGRLRTQYVLGEVSYEYVRETLTDGIALLAANGLRAQYFTTRWCRIMLGRADYVATIKTDDENSIINPLPGRLPWRLRWKGKEYVGSI